MTISKTELRNKYKALRAAGRFHGTIKRALELRQQREANRPYTRDFLCHRCVNIAAYYMRRRRLERGIVVPIGRQLEAELAGIVKRANPHLRNWKGGVSETGSLAEAMGWYSIWSTGSNSDWRKRSTFERGVSVHSMFSATNTVSGTIHCGPHQRNVTLPKGWVFDIDENGLFIRRSVLVRSLGPCDFHPTAADLLRMSPKELIATARENARVRAAQERQQRQEARALMEQVRRAEREGATVCLADSLRVGNCYAGTVRWAARAGLARNKHHKPSQIAKLAGAAGHEARRVMLVIRYANLSDHRS
jgi:hypothetical protein